MHYTDDPVLLPSVPLQLSIEYVEYKGEFMVCRRESVSIITENIKSGLGVHECAPSTLRMLLYISWTVV